MTDVEFKSHFDELVLRAARVRELSALEHMFCNLRDVLEPFDIKLQQRLTENKKQWKNPGLDEPEMRREWDKLYTVDLAQFRGVADGWRFLKLALTGDPAPHAAIEKWITDLCAAGEQVMTAFTTGATESLHMASMKLRLQLGVCRSSHQTRIEVEIEDMRSLARVLGADL